MNTPLKRTLIAVTVGALAAVAAACGLPDDIVGNQPTATSNPNVVPTPTEVPPAPVVTSTSTPTVTPSPTPVGHSDLETALGAAQERWFENGYANYDFTFRWLCFCPPEYGQPARVSVRNGVVESVVDADTGEPHGMPITEFRTIDELFAYIWEEINGSTEKIEIVFDEATGAPLSASFDRIVMAIDDEISFEVWDLEKVDVSVGAQDDLDAARAAWDAAGLTAYSFEFRWNCFCVPTYTDQVQIIVENGEIVAVSWAADATAIPQEEWDRYETIDGLLDLIQDAIDQDAVSIRAEYDEDQGYPVDVFIDYDFRIADEERGFVLKNFGPAAS